LEAVQNRIRVLETELRQKDAAREAVLEQAAGRERDAKVAAMLSRIQTLEAQNSQLRLAAVRQEQVLQQSRKFIETHLARWAPNAGSAAGGGAATAAATAPAAAATAATASSNGTSGIDQQQGGQQ
jgi:hypothetical protein